MRSDIKQVYIPVFVLVLFCIPLYFMNIMDVHDWGDDFSQYIKQAWNIAHGIPFYKTGYIPHTYNWVFAPPYYPPGYSLLLSPIVKIWGIAIKPMLYFNSFLLSCLLFTLYYYFRKYAGIIASICLSVICVYSGYVIGFKQYVLSDIASWLFVCLYITLRNSDKIKKGKIILIVICLTMSILIRTQTALLLLAEGIWLIADMIWQRKVSIKSMLFSVSSQICAATLLLLFLLNHTIFYAPTSSFSFYQYLFTYPGENIKEVFTQNVVYMKDLLIGVMQCYPRDSFWHNVVAVTDVATFLLAIPGLIIALRKNRIDNYYFILVYILMLLLPVRQGERYILSIVNIYILYSYLAVRLISTKLPQWAGPAGATLFTISFLISGRDDFRGARHPYTEGYIPAHNDKQAFAYIQNHVGDNEIIAFLKPRALTLFTGKKTVPSAPQVSFDVNRKFYDSLGVKYILIDSAQNKDDAFFTAYLRHTGQARDSVTIARGYVLYRIR